MAVKRRACARDQLLSAVRQFPVQKSMDNTKTVINLAKLRESKWNVHRNLYKETKRRKRQPREFSNTKLIPQTRALPQTLEPESNALKLGHFLSCFCL